jgi:hypothetical protein
VELDPEHKVYLDASKFDDSRTLEGDGSVARRIAGQFASALQTLLSLLVSL